MFIVMLRHQLGPHTHLLLTPPDLASHNMTMVTFRRFSAISVCLGVAWSQPAAAPAFDVASVKVAAPPQGQGLAALREDTSTSSGRLTMRNVKLSTCIRWAYKLNLYEIAAPDWMESARFDITAKPVQPSPEDQLRLMLRRLLTERFKLVAHRQPKTLSGYALVLGKDQPRLQAAEGGGEGSMTGAAMVSKGTRCRSRA